MMQAMSYVLVIVKALPEPATVSSLPDYADTDQKSLRFTAAGNHTLEASPSSFLSVLPLIHFLCDQIERDGHELARPSLQAAAWAETQTKKAKFSCSWEGPSYKMMTIATFVLKFYTGFR